MFWLEVALVPRGNMAQMTQRPVTWILFRRQCVVQWLWHYNFVREEVHSVSRFSWSKNVFPIEINLHFIGVYGSDVLRVQHVTKWCSEFEGGHVNIRGSVRRAHRSAQAHEEWMWTHHEWRNWFWKTDKSQFEIYPIHWSCPLELYTVLSLKNWAARARIVNPMCTASELCNSYRDGRDVSMFAGLCWKIMIPQWNKWNKLEVVMTFNLIFDTRNVRYLKSFIHFPSYACNCCIFSNVITFFGRSTVLVDYLLKDFVVTHGFRGRRTVLVIQYRACLTGNDMNKRVILTLALKNLSVRCVT